MSTLRSIFAEIEISLMIQMLWPGSSTPEHVWILVHGTRGVQLKPACFFSCELHPENDERT